MRHQVEELPQIAVRVTEHRCQRLRCPGCGVELPVEIARSAFGPRLQAAVAALSVRNRVSRRDLVELCEELFGARISTGSIDAILSRAGDALEQPYARLLGRVRRSREPGRLSRIGRLGVDGIRRMPRGFVAPAPAPAPAPARTDRRQASATAGYETSPPQALQRA